MAEESPKRKTSRSKSPTIKTEGYEDFKPLVDLCKAGRLFEVQEWIASGKPVNLPASVKKRTRKMYPLQVAVEKGFHSLVQVLLDGGAIINDGFYNAFDHAIASRRLDLIKLMVERGADINSIGMAEIFDSWDPAVVEYFIELGADVETGNPLAAALCWKIRTALGVFKRHRKRFPSFQEQVNIALRHHCGEGNIKWVSLLLWAGADPFAKGPGSPEDEPDPDEDLCALEYAALCGRFDVFKLGKIKVEPDHPIAIELLRSACMSKKADFLIDLLAQGFKPQELKDQGSFLINACLQNFWWASGFDWNNRERTKNIDSNRSRETIRMIHILARQGAKWLPADRDEINDARRSLLKLNVDYTIEFVWIMSKYDSCSRETIEQLLKTPTMKRHIAGHQRRIDELLNEFSGIR